MDIMNLIHAICLSYTRISLMPRTKIISRYKENNILNKHISKFKDTDIFSLSDNLISFLISLDCIKGSLYGVTYGDNFISIDLDYYVEDTKASITYYPKSNRFEIINDYVSYTIYRNTKNGYTVGKMWEQISEDLKDVYIDIIIQASDYVNSSNA